MLIRREETFDFATPEDVFISFLQEIRSRAKDAIFLASSGLAGLAN